MKCFLTFYLMTQVLAQSPLECEIMQNPNATDIDKILSLTSSDVKCTQDYVNMTLGVNLKTPLIGNTRDYGVYLRVISFNDANKSSFSTIFEERFEQVNQTMAITMPYSVPKTTKNLFLRASVIDGANTFYKIPSNETCASKKWENDQQVVSSYNFMHFDNKDETIIIPECTVQNENMFWLLVAILIAALTGLSVVTMRTLCPACCAIEVVTVEEK